MRNHRGNAGVIIEFILVLVMPLSADKRAMDFES